MYICMHIYIYRLKIKKKYICVYQKQITMQLHGMMKRRPLISDFHEGFETFASMHQLHK